MNIPGMNSFSMNEKLWERFDPAKSDDPIARKIDWGPLRGGGTNFTTKKLYLVNGNRVEFRGTFFSKLLGGFFFLGGIPFLLFAFRIVPIEETDPWMSFAFTIAGILFFIVGGFLAKSAFQTIVFDRTTGTFSKGKVVAGNAKNQCQLSEIHALQLVSERIRGENNTYTSYELNLVLQDGRRINVMDHGGRKRFLTDTKQLAEFLNVPIWDVS